MKKGLLLWAICALVPSQYSWADDPFTWPAQDKSPEKKFSAAYFNGQAFEQIKTVQIVGVARTPENIEREVQVARLMNQNIKQLQYCYERALAKGPIPLVDVTYFFTVDSDGSFKDLTADVLVMSDSLNMELLACSSARFQTFQAPTWNGDRTFRFKVRFQTSRQ